VLFTYFHAEYAFGSNNLDFRFFYDIIYYLNEGNKIRGKVEKISDKFHLLILFCGDYDDFVILLNFLYFSDYLSRSYQTV